MAFPMLRAGGLLSSLQQNTHKFVVQNDVCLNFPSLQQHDIKGYNISFVFGNKKERKRQ